MLVEEKGVRILTDPGTLSTQQDELKDIHFVLITHEHYDHFHIESVKKVLANNPTAQIITNKSVGALLEKEGLAYTLVEDGQSYDAGGVLVEGFGKEHALMHSSLPRTQNTGYFVGGRLFYPGDAFSNPHKEVDILALPVAGPWMKLSEAIDYALELKPKVCFPVHDGMLKHIGPVHTVPAMILEPLGIKFIIQEIGKPSEF